MSSLRHFLVSAGALALACTAAQVSAIPFDNTTGAPVKATVGTAGDYADLKAACDAFNAVTGGINRPWTMEIVSDLTEANLVSLANTFGVDGSLTIKPAATTTPKITFTYAGAAPGGFYGHWVIGSNSITAVPASDTDIPDTDGKYTIDGSNTVGGTTRDLTLVGGETTAIASPVNRLLRVVGRTKGMTVKNTNIIFNDTAGSASCVGLGGGIVGSTNFSPDNFTLQNCSLTAGQLATVTATAFGLETSPAANGALPSGNAINGLTIRDCDITVRQRGIFMNGAGDAVIEDNNITITNTATSTLTNAIFHLNSNNDLAFTQVYNRNVISVESAISTAGGNGAMGIIIDGGSVGAAGTFTVTNNIIKGAFLTNSAPIDCSARGISFATVTGNLVAEHNTIVIPASSASGGTAGRVAGISLPLALTTGTASIKNNIVKCDEIDGTAAAIYLAAATGVTSSGNNVVAAAGGRVGRVAATDYADLTAWQGAGFDTTGGSQSVDPATASPAWDAAFHFAYKPVTGLGVVAASTSLVDVDGDARPATGALPGADEPAVDFTSVTDWAILNN